MVSVLRQYFGSEDRMSLQRSSLKWDRDPNVSKVFIDAEDNQDFRDGDTGPRLLVDLENQGFPRDSIGDRNDYDPLSGQENFTMRMESAYLIEAWSNKKLEAWTMADEVRIFIHTYRMVIAHQYGFNFLRPSQVVKPVKSRVYEDYWISRIIVSFDISDNWGAMQEQLKAGPITLDLQAS